MPEAHAYFKSFEDNDNKERPSFPILIRTLGRMLLRKDLIELYFVMGSQDFKTKLKRKGKLLLSKANAIHLVTVIRHLEYGDILKWFW